MSKAIRVLGLAGLGLLTTTLAGLTIGARVAQDLLPSMMPGVLASIAAIGAGVLVMGVPLFIAGRLLAWTEPYKPHRPTLTLSTLTAWNTALLALLVGLMPGSTGEALVENGTWFLVGQPSPQLTRWVQGAGHALGGTTPEVVEVVEPDPETIYEESEAPIEPDTPPEPDVFTAADIFELRANTVVIVETQKSVDGDGVVGELAKRLGMTQLDGHGSGFTVSDEGLLVTNHHVIQGAERITIVTKDGRRLSADLLVEDPAHDLALLHVHDAKLPYVSLTRDAPKPGTATFALGAPLGMNYTLTEGIISAHRNVGDTDFLQMQTPVAPGSSGGPLFDDSGEVVGVNTATAGNGNMNLAVQAKHVTDLLLRHRDAKEMPLTVPGLKVTELTTDQFEVHPTSQMKLEQVVGYFGNALNSCFETVPTDAIVLTLSDRGAVAVLTGESTDNCLRESVDGLGIPMMLVLTHQLGMPEEATLTVRYDNGLAVVVHGAPVE